MTSSIPKGEVDVDALASGITDFASDLLGKKIPKPKIKKKRKEISKLLSNLSTSILVLAKMQQNPPRNDDEWMRSIDLFDAAMHKIGNFPPGVHIAKYLMKTYPDIIKLPLEFAPYFRRARYLDYCQEISTICSKIFDLGLGTRVDQFFNQTAENIHAANLPPLFFIKARRSFQYLSKPHRKITRLQLEKSKGVYLEMAGAYEQSISLLIGIFQILENKQPDPSQILGMSLRSKTEYILKRRPNLTSALSITIRNSLAHPHSYLVHFNKHTIEFHDSKEMQTVDFRKFVRLTRELSALSAAVSMTYFLFMAKRWSRIATKYDSLKTVVDNVNHDNWHVAT